MLTSSRIPDFGAICCSLVIKSWTWCILCHQALKEHTHAHTCTHTHTHTHTHTPLVSANVRTGLKLGTHNTNYTSLCLKSLESNRSILTIPADVTSGDPLAPLFFLCFTNYLATQYHHLISQTLHWWCYSIQTVTNPFIKRKTVTISSRIYIR